MLTRWSGDLPGKRGDVRVEFQHQVVLKPHNLTAEVPEALTMACGRLAEPKEPSIAEELPALIELFDTAYEKDPIPNDVLGQLRRGQLRSKQLSLAECRDNERRLIYRGRLNVPNYMLLKVRLIQDFYETPAAGHPGRSKTLELLARQYYWLRMHKDVDRFLRNYHTCQQSRTSRHALFGILRPMPIPDGAWCHISMDFITSLPWSNGYNAILVVVCRLTKMRHFIPCRDTCMAEQLADLYAQQTFRLHGLPRTNVSNRGTQFTTKFWRALCKILKTEPLLSMPFHPETDGQMEWFNAVFEQYLRAYVNYLQDDWELWLHLAEFAANNQASETTGILPFFVNHGQDPLWQSDLTAVGAGAGASATPSGEERSALQVATKMKEIAEHLQAEILQAQATSTSGVGRQEARASACIPHW